MFNPTICQSTGLSQHRVQKQVSVQSSSKTASGMPPVHHLHLPNTVRQDMHYARQLQNGRWRGVYSSPLTLLCLKKKFLHNAKKQGYKSNPVFLLCFSTTFNVHQARRYYKSSASCTGTASFPQPLGLPV